MKSRGPYKKIQGGDGQEVQDLTRSLCMSLGEVISHTPVHQQLSHLHKDLSSLLECFTSIAQVPCLLEVVLQYARCGSTYQDSSMTDIPGQLRSGVT
ncbi:uncharacterized protein [Nicotiana sylvestris]|uniref:uncharacterized protein isoform X10 n=1 Tax=Nicotiana sylvestris TaxID=4096 RepID=UPI00388C7D07